GDYSTKFIENEYPGGFTGVVLEDHETADLVALAAAVHSARHEHSRKAGEEDEETSVKQYTENQQAVGGYRQGLHLYAGTGGPDADEEDEDELDGVRESVVVVLGAHPNQRPYRADLIMSNILQVTITPLDAEGQASGRTVKRELANLEWHSEQPLAFASFLPTEGGAEGMEEGQEGEGGGGEREVVMQYLGRSAAGYTLRYLGSEQPVKVLTPQEHNLSRYMLPPVIKDASLSLLCPMPGTLISCSVVAGQRVEVGQQLAVVEAMKMQNVLRAE
ncbi:hypothetical protein B484DRAFT_404170, partial [Ochromonadaceae sp. CCMP2298]